MEKQLAKFSESDQIIKGVDFNSRIGAKVDLIMRIGNIYISYKRVMNWILSRHIGTTRMSLKTIIQSN